MTQFDAHLRTDGAMAIIDLAGTIDRDAEAALDAAYSHVGQASSVVLDFAGVSYINSTGIAVIVGLLAKARAN